MKLIDRAAIIGGGVIGAGWIARLIENGIDVRVYDPADDAEQKVEAVLKNSRHAYSKLTSAPRPSEGGVSFCDSIAEAVAGAELIVESVPERLDIKQAVYAEIEAAAATDAIIASSTSGIMPSDLQAKMEHPERLLVGHPFNPVYLLPLVELVGGEKTAAVTIERAGEIYHSLGMHPLHVKKEIEAFIADRLLEAIWRESLWLVKDGIATTRDIDDAVRYGFGLRYAQMGVFDTYRVAGGEAGMRHFMEQFGPCLKWPWTKLMDVPEFTDELVDLIAGQSDEQSGYMSIREMERIRDDNLIAILQALKGNDWAAGHTLARYESQLLQAANDE
jgi:carnitine 3-dehydrogenase